MSPDQNCFKHFKDGDLYLEIKAQMWKTVVRYSALKYKVEKSLIASIQKILEQLISMKDIICRTLPKLKKKIHSWLKMKFLLIHPQYVFYFKLQKCPREFPLDSTEIFLPLFFSHFLYLFFLLLFLFFCLSISLYVLSTLILIVAKGEYQIQEFYEQRQWKDGCLATHSWT